MFAANLGQVAEARHQLNTKWSSKRGPDDYGQARFPVWWGPSREAPDETCDYPGCNEVIDESRITLQHMLLQSDNHGERLILFPSWPHEWDVTFQIRAERNTTLSGEVKDGKLLSLRVVPEERRKDVVVLPLHGAPAAKIDDAAGVRPLRTGFYFTDLSSGEVHGALLARVEEIAPLTWRRYQGNPTGIAPGVVLGHGTTAGWDAGGQEGTSCLQVRGTVYCYTSECSKRSG